MYIINYVNQTKQILSLLSIAGEIITFIISAIITFVTILK